MRSIPWRYWLFLLACCVSLKAQSQGTVLQLMKSSKGFYLGHKVMPKQSLYSLGRMYSVHPNFLAAYNGLEPSKGLRIDQILRIPLTDTNFQRQKGEGVPIYLTAATDDVIADLATFVDVRISDMQCWNRFSGTEVKKGTRWIIGFLITSELTSQRMKIPCTAPVQTSSPPTPNPPPAPTPVPVSTPAPAPTSASFFQSAYLEQIQKTPVTQQLSVIASTFRTQSGWMDGKHYLLINNLVPGTIVKLVNLQNQKVAFAKVLGEMAGIRQNEGLDIRISDATSRFLEIADNKRFVLQVHY